MWNTDEVKPAPKSWSVVFDPKEAAKYNGKITAYDDPIYIADAAVYLKAHQPDLGIDDPVRARPGAVRRRDRPAQAAAPNIGEYWSDYTKEIQAFTNGDDWSSAQPGRTSTATLQADGQPKAGQRDRSIPRRARPDGRTPGCSARRQSIRTACTSGCTTSPTPMCRRRSRSGSARRPPTRRRATITAAKELPRTDSATTTTRPTGVLEARLLLEDTDRRLRRRPRRCLQGLQRLGPGLDRDQGMTGLEATPDGARWKRLTHQRRRRRGRWAAGSPTSSTAAPACRRGRSWRTGPLAGRRLPRLAGGAARHRVLELDALSGEIDQNGHARQLQDHHRRARLPDDRAAGRS